MGGYGLPHPTYVFECEVFVPKRPDLPIAPTPPVPPKAPVEPPPTLSSAMANKNFFMEWVKPIERWRKYEDYGLFSTLEVAHLIIAGAEGITFVPETLIPIPTPSELSVPALRIISPVGKGIINTNPLSTELNDGQAIYIENVEFPIRGSTTRDLTVGSLSQRRDRRTDRIFLGVRIGDSVYFRVQMGSSVSGIRIKETDFVPIEWGINTTTPPNASETYTDGDGSVQIRKFSGTTAQSLRIPWEVPEDIDVDEGVKFRVVGFITDSAFFHGASFKLNGYSIGDGDQLGGTPGSTQELVLSGTYSIDDRFDTGWSSPITINDLERGELAMLTFERDTADASDTYTDSLGVYGIKIEYTREATG